LAAVVVIPARFASTRFPGKVVASATGKPLVQHVVDQVRKCRNIKEIVVATDDQRVVTALRTYGTRCVLTDPGHPSGTDRVAEVAGLLGGDAIIINVQGDEPEIEPEVIDRLASEMEEQGWAMGTVATPFRSPADPRDPNLVKVVLSRSGRAMYFSRLAIPFVREPIPGISPAYYLHVGIYAYRRDTLLRLSKLAPTPCEIAEKLEQLRALENDVPIGVVVIDRASHGIDTPQQYEAFVKRQKELLPT